MQPWERERAKLALLYSVCFCKTHCGNRSWSGVKSREEEEYLCTITYIPSSLHYKNFQEAFTRFFCHKNCMNRSCRWHLRTWLSNITNMISSWWSLKRGRDTQRESVYVCYVCMSSDNHQQTIWLCNSFVRLTSLFLWSQVIILFFLCATPFVSNHTSSGSIRV
jgi:hypothetical protein